MIKIRRMGLKAILFLEIRALDNGLKENAIQIFHRKQRFL